jgi:hypothetical protein
VVQSLPYSNKSDAMLVFMPAHTHHQMIKSIAESHKLELQRTTRTD